MNNKKINQIAKALNLLANLPDGDGYVQIIGNGDENSNLEALCYWVINQKDLLNTEHTSFLVEQLLMRLLDTFYRFNDVNSY
jgi:acylphosphatase